MSSAERRRTSCVAVGSFVKALNQIASLLKLNREEEGGGDIDAPRLLCSPGQCRRK